VIEESLPRRRFVCFGSSRVLSDEPAACHAEAVGRILAERGIDVLSGGYEGVMGAATRGAVGAGGASIGVVTPIFRGRTPHSQLSAVWTEPDYLARLSTLCRQADGFVALPGALGTLSEWTTAWCLMSIREAPGPLYLFEDPWKPLVEAITALPEFDRGHLEHVHFVRRPDDLARALDDHPAT